MKTNSAADDSSGYQNSERMRAVTCKTKFRIAEVSYAYKEMSSRQVNTTDRNRCIDKNKDDKKKKKSIIKWQRGKKRVWQTKGMNSILKFAKVSSAPP